GRSLALTIVTGIAAAGAWKALGWDAAVNESAIGIAMGLCANQLTARRLSALAAGGPRPGPPPAVFSPPPGPRQVAVRPVPGGARFTAVTPVLMTSAFEAVPPVAPAAPGQGHDFTAFVPGGTASRQFSAP